MEDEIKKVLNSMMVNCNLIDNWSEDNSHIDDYEHLLSVTAKELVTLGLPSVSGSLPTGDEVWYKAQETSKDRFEEWFDNINGH